MVIKENHAVVLCTFNTTYSCIIYNIDMCSGKGLHYTSEYYNIKVPKELANHIKRK